MTLASRLAISDFSKTNARIGEFPLRKTTMVNITEARKKLIPLHIERMIEPLFSMSLSPCGVLCPPFKVYSTSIYMVLSGEGFREGLQPSLSPIVQIYAALNGSFVSVFPDLEALTDGLNPLTISQTARTISCRKMGNARGM